MKRCEVLFQQTVVYGQQSVISRQQPVSLLNYFVSVKN